VQSETTWYAHAILFGRNAIHQADQANASGL
jgi:hypothetical protein